MRRRRRTRRGLLAAAVVASAAAGAWLGGRPAGRRQHAAPVAAGPARVDEASWRGLLEELSDLAIGDRRLRPRLDAARVAARWLGEAPAEEAAIAATEARLGLLLPPSYKGFLRVSDGWHRPSPAVGLLRPVAQVAPFLAENRDWAMALAAPPVPLPDGPPPDHVQRHILGTLQLSRYDRAAGDGAVLLLNPGSTAAGTGEMEAWFLGTGAAGTTVHPSFWHLMAAEREALRFIRDRG